MLAASMKTLALQIIQRDSLLHVILILWTQTAPLYYTVKHQVPDKSPTFCTKTSTESQLNKETIEPPPNEEIKHLFTNESWKPVVPQPDISLPDGPPPLCGGG